MRCHFRFVKYISKPLCSYSRDRLYSSKSKNHPPRKGPKKNHFQIPNETRTQVKCHDCSKLVRSKPKPIRQKIDSAWFLKRIILFGSCRSTS